MTDISNFDDSERLRDVIVQAAANDLPLQLVGGGSKAFYGNPGEGEVLEVAHHSGIIDYDPAELVITLRGGCRLADVGRLLADHGQMFGFEPPCFNDEATIGGMVASALAGPRRAYAGGVRDFILGVKILDGRGDVLNFGGRVIKNVAGFDVSRLMAGSMGTLGVLLEVSLRVIPQFEREVTLALQHDDAQTHIDWINQLSGQPLPISASMWREGQSLLRLSGSEQGVGSAAARIGGELTDTAADDIWRQLREHRHAFFADQKRIARIALPPATHFQIDGEQLIEWGGAQRWLVGDFDTAVLRERLAHFSGGLCVYRGADAAQPAFHPLGEALLTLHRNLKSRFDPARIFNRGRLYPGL